MAKASKRVALYVRVSTGDQTVDNQVAELRRVGERNGWEIVEVYADQGISGAKGRDKRPAFDRLLKDATRGKFDAIAAWSVDRLGRSLPDLVAFLGEVHALGIDLYLHQQAIDTATPAGRALFGMMGVFAEFERAILIARINAGLDRARAKGTRLGRKPIPPIVLDRVRTSLAKGLSIRKAAEAAGVSVGTAHRIKVGLALAAE